MPKWNVAVHFSRIQTNKLVVVFYFVMYPQNIGMINTVKDGIIVMVNAQGEAIFVNRRDVKIFHFPQ
ncbi:hypothetical protein [Peribacillus simplex]|uniref:hypothetical protein n=1 Tax=Peribacillus simplex TaxID=1478 RepID=UPI003D2D585A